MTGVRIERVVTSGTFSLDGGTWPVENNVWLVGDEHEVVVIDAAHDADAIEQAIGGRLVSAILCTHAHNDHVNAAPDLAARTGGKIWLHPADLELWRLTHPHWSPDRNLVDGATVPVAGLELQVLHTPGHAPGAVCFHAPELGVLFSGDTLFAGGPGATGRSFSNFDTIIDSIRERLLTLPPATAVHTGHGEATTIGAEAPHLQEWITRGR
ncbi:MAG TPA: MBL fold metallo-hydrolase [Sporichthyaceae bacterium]|jgi:glyoxylase-like metal-dependent hydrolase (beta-lactamase superfamily II)|nr:MBL fold metallo-hydrolase [Sporichthyaceae bacterium]